MRYFLLILIAFSVAPSALRAADRPNVIFMFTDDHAYQAISAYGSKVNKTPNIDRIAAEGMIFRNQSSRDPDRQAQSHQRFSQE